MVYLLQAYFGRDGREEAESLLERRSGDQDRPRILGAFNQPTPDWLSFFLFTYFTDRDGKFQLSALAESGFDPLARTCRFMIKEEAHHMFVGDSGVSRIIQRTCEVLRDTPAADGRELGVIDLPTIQKHINFHFSLTLDLFGAEISTNAAGSYSRGLKGRFQEHRLDDDHLLSEATYPVLHYEQAQFVTKEVPALSALNERLRADFIDDVSKGVRRWNQIIADHHIDFGLSLPHRRFNRRIGVFARIPITPDGKAVSEPEWQQQSSQWLPTDEDKEYLRSLMGEAMHRPGEFAHWIAPPAQGINHQPVDFQYVRFD